MIIRHYYEGVTGERREEVLLSRSEQESEYERCLREVLENPRAVLDSLETRGEFQVDWKRYGLWKNGRRSC